MEIILIRHGKPESATNQSCTAEQFHQWVKRYKHAPIDKNSSPNREQMKHFEGFHLISSALPRAKSSALIAFNRTPQQSYAWFNEMDIPRYKLPLRLNAWTWVYLCRALWTLGVKGKFESYKEAKQRAQSATSELEALAREHKTLVAVGHGYMNLHIRRYLKKRGWTVTEKSNQYWGVSKLIFNQST
jgi:broad specificity phosphatase PhoE